MELDIDALDMLPAQAESALFPCNLTCQGYRTCATFTCGGTDY